MSRARELVKDLFRPNPFIYWIDFLSSAVLGWGTFGLALMAPIFSSRQIFFVTLSCLSLYRAVLFIHEIVHFKKGTFKVFRWVWNLLCGFPLMLPIFLYQSIHFDHHKQSFYGTEKDGEYFPFALKGRKWIIIHILFSFLVPIIFLARFTVLTPLSLVNAKLRFFLWPGCQPWLSTWITSDRNLPGGMRKIGKYRSFWRVSLPAHLWGLF